MAARLAWNVAVSRIRGGFEKSARLIYGLYLYLVTAAFGVPGWTLVLLGIPRRALCGIVFHGSRSIWLSPAFLSRFEDRSSLTAERALSFSCPTTPDTSIRFP
jgi:hypothetical protein